MGKNAIVNRKIMDMKEETAEILPGMKRKPGELFWQFFLRGK